MSTYKQLLPYVSPKTLTFARFDRSESFDRKMYSGVSLRDEEPPTVVIDRKTGRAPDFLSGLGTTLLLVSPRVRALLEGTADALFLEFLVPKVVSPSPRKQNVWFVLNVLGPLNAFDRERSDYDLFDSPGPNGVVPIRKVRAMRFLEEVVAGRNLFTVKEFPASWFVAEQLEESFVRAGIEDFRTLTI